MANDKYITANSNTVIAYGMDGQEIFLPNMFWSTASVSSVLSAAANGRKRQEHDGFFVCAYCRIINSISEKFCTQCGAPYGEIS